MSNVHLRRRAALCLLLAMGTGGCIRGTLPARERYRLRLPDPAPIAASAAGPLAGTLAVLSYQTPGLYGEDFIVYRVNDTEYGTYPSREWALPLGDQLGVLSEAILRRAPITREPALFDPPSSRAQTWIWRGAVREFEEVNRGSALLAAVRLDATLVRAADDSVVWSGSVRLERAVPSATMTAVVGMLSQLAAEAVEKLARDASAAVGNGRLTRAP